MLPGTARETEMGILIKRQWLINKKEKKDCPAAKEILFRKTVKGHFLLHLPDYSPD